MYKEGKLWGRNGKPVVARTVLFTRHTSYFLPLTSYFLLLISYFLLVPSSSAQNLERSQAQLQGNGLAPPILVIPDTIDFGRVRIGQQRDSSFTIEDTGASPITLTALDYWRAVQYTEFRADSIVGSPSLKHLINPPRDSVFFLPTQLGPDTGRIPIYWTDGTTTSDSPTVYLFGTGVAPNVISHNDTFGSLRVDSSSAWDTVWIVNNGTDTTVIDSVTIVNPSEILDSDFSVSLDSLPPSGSHTSPLRIGYEGGDSTLSFAVQFHPQSLGRDTLVIRIHTIDGDSVFDTLTGRGVEPLVLLSLDTIDFGTITIHQNSPLSIDTVFVVSNAFGTYQALLDTIINYDDTDFTVLLNQPTGSLNETLAIDSALTGKVIFNITQQGDFTDTVYIKNDTRYHLYNNSDSTYQPMIILKAKVRIGPIGSFNVSFDTITTCDTVSDSVLIPNNFHVELTIDSLKLLSDTDGFSYRQNTFLHRINIAPDSSYPLYLDYNFPPDSLNGTQTLKMGLFQHGVDNEPPVVDTVTATVVRKQRVFTLQAHPPVAGAPGTSAADISELKLPITVEGPRAGVTELNSWTLSLQFSNDLFVPTGIDLTGSLSGAGNVTPYWDQSSRTYNIIATGTAVSDPTNISNDLLLTILMQAYVTTDTVVTVTPTFTWKVHPCAYNLQSFTLSIPYADDCGDPTIRDFMLHETPSFILTGSWPNPANQSDGVSIGYQAAEPSEVSCRVYNAVGQELGRFETAVGGGAGTIALPEGLLPASGQAFVRVEAVSADGIRSAIQTCKIDVMK